MDIETALIFTDALVFKKVGLHLSDLQRAMLQASWSWQRQSYDTIAETYGYSSTYLKHDVGPKLWKLLSEVLGEKVNKTSFRAAIERRWLAEEAQPQPDLSQPALSQFDALPAALSHSSSTPTIDWGEPIDIRFFYGRQPELAQLEQWIQVDRCRLVTVLGMGGMGKTSLAVKVAQQLAQVTASEHSPFERIVWRSLRHAPPLQELLTDLLHRSHQETTDAEPLERQLTKLLHVLQKQRWLLILDNVETILQPDESNTDISAFPQPGKSYRAGYERYGEWFRQIGETLHQSCLLLTSREKPPEITFLEGAVLPVRSLRLSGLSQAAGQELCQLKGTLQGSENEWHCLIEGYSGNPLSLKLISTTIQTLFNGSISEFLQQNTFVFGGVRSLIQQQVQRLSRTEKNVMYWLAIYREPVAFTELRSDSFPTISPQALLEVLQSLEHQSLIETTVSIQTGKPITLFFLQPAVMEHMTNQFVEQVCQEIENNLHVANANQNLLCRSHTLLKAQAKDYIREAQVRLILQPTLDRLLLIYSTNDVLCHHLSHLLMQLRRRSSLEVGYAGGNLLNLLCQCQPLLKNYDFSHLVIWQAYLQQTQLHQVNFSYSDLTHSVFLEPLGMVFSVAFSPDGTALVTGDAEGGLRLWLVADGTLLQEFAGHQGWVWAVAFSADGRILASCSSDKTIRLWDTETGHCLQVLQGHSGSIWSIAFSPDGSLVASGSDEPIISLWDVQTGNYCQTLSGHTGRILSVNFSPDGQTLASGSADGTIRLWQIQTDTCQVIPAHTDRVWCVAFSHDGRWLASSSADGTIKLWNPATQECLQVWQEHRDRVRSVAFSPDDRLLLSGSDDQTVRLWDIHTGQCLQNLRGHANSIFTVSFNADGQTLVSGSADQTVRIWHAETGRCLKTLKGYTNSVFSVSFSPDGQMLASGSTDRSIRLWQRDGTYRTLPGHEGWVTSVAFHPQQGLLASSSTDCTVRLWSVTTGQCLKILQDHRNWVQSVAFNAAGDRLASAGDDCTVRLWDSSTGQLLATLEGHTSWIWAVAFAPQGDRLASSSDDGTIRIWSITTGQCLHILEGHTRQVQSIAFSPDGQVLASGSGDETVRLWAVATGACIQVLRGHENNVWSVAFSATGDFLASGSLDQTVRLWDMQTGTCCKTLSVLTHSVRSSISFNPVLAEANLLATGSHNGTIQIWDSTTGQCLHTWLPDRPYQDTRIAEVTGLTLAQKAALKALGAVE